MVFILPFCWKLLAVAQRREFNPWPGSEVGGFARAAGASFVNRTWERRRGRRVPLLCPFSDLLKAASAPTEKKPWHCSSASSASCTVPVWPCCALCLGIQAVSAAWVLGWPPLGRARGTPRNPRVFLTCPDRGEIMSLMFRVLLG